jgi:hypothetical protein
VAGSISDGSNITPQLQPEDSVYAFKPNMYFGNSARVQLLGGFHEKNSHVPCDPGVVRWDDSAGKGRRTDAVGPTNIQTDSISGPGREEQCCHPRKD